MSLLLSSVRNTTEAAVALRAGTDWLDVKEPRNGALGAADPAVVRAVVRLTAGRVPVSATIGDTWETPWAIAPAVAEAAATGVDYVKVGVAAGIDDGGVAEALRQCAERVRGVIVVWMAERLPPDALLDAVANAGVAGMMLDTAVKDGPALTALMTPRELAAFVERVHGHGLLCGLAGRLEVSDIPALIDCGADYLGFRSALCAAGSREQHLDAAAFAHVRSALTRSPEQHKMTMSEVT